MQQRAFLLSASGGEECNHLCLHWLVCFVESRVKVQGPELTVKAEKEIVHFMDNRVVAMPPHGGVYPTINLGPDVVRALPGVCCHLLCHEKLVIFGASNSSSYLFLNCDKRSENLHLVNWSSRDIPQASIHCSRVNILILRE